jgi:hypothetical protein
VENEPKNISNGNIAFPNSSINELIDEKDNIDELAESILKQF